MEKEQGLATVSTGIVVSRIFGKADLLELYSEYVAKKICEQVKGG